MTWLFSASDTTHSDPHKVATPPRKDCALIPQSAVLLGVLKAIECELRSRHQLGTTPTTSATPLWFLAETERNLYLWLTGTGLANASRTVFWVDTNALICKRRKQLSRHSNSFATYGFNPFITRDQNSGEPNNEGSYLDELERLGCEIFKRAAMISRISDSLYDELIPPGKARKRVVLPFDIKAARKCSPG
jgi:hypothetical protein